MALLGMSMDIKILRVWDNTVFRLVYCSCIKYCGLVDRQLFCMSRIRSLEPKKHVHRYDKGLYVSAA